MGDVELDPATRTVPQKGKPVELTSVEFNLLQVLLREAGRVVPREHLVDIVLSRKFSPFDRSIDMHVSKIRKKLGDSETGVDHIKTVRGVGYIFTRPQDLRSKRSGAARHEKPFSQDFSSYWVAQALFLALAILLPWRSSAREPAVWEAQQAKFSTRRSRPTSRAARPKRGATSRTYAIHSISAPTFSMIREKS